MGTRHLVMVKCDGKIKVAQYGQWDGYLEGQGKTIAKFLHNNKTDLNLFKQKVRRLRWAWPTQVEKTWVEAGAEPGQTSVTLDIADKHSEMFPELSRDTGAKILKVIHDRNVDRVGNSKSFLRDSLFCEYAYLLDLDKETVTFYKGFQHYGERDDGSTVYGPCKKMRTYKFKDWTVKKVKELSTWF